MVAASAAAVYGGASPSGIAGVAGGGEPAGLDLSSAASTSVMEGMMYDLRATLQEDLRGLHLEVLRELEAQRHEMRDALREERLEMAALREENARLQEENRRLRGPMGGLPPPPPS